VLALSGAKVLIAGSTIDLGRLASLGLGARGASITGTRVTVSNSAGPAAEARSGAVLSLTDSVLQDSTACGIISRDSKIVLKRAILRRALCGVAALHGTTLESDDSRFEGSRYAALASMMGEENTITLRGSGNVGAQMNAAGVRLVPPPRGGVVPPPPGGASSDPPSSRPAPSAPVAPPADQFDPQSKPVLLR
jgi:hypothetical protein